MKIETQIQEDHQAKLIVEFDATQLQEARQKAARKIAHQTKIPGFRPGKAPYSIVVRTVGEGAILEEAMEILVDDQYSAVLDEAKIKPYGPGQLNKVVSLDPPTFEFIVPLEAEVLLEDYQNIRLPYELIPVNDLDIDKVINDLREQQVVLDTVDRPAKEGDQVFIRITGTLLDLVEPENAVLVNDRPMPITITSKKTISPSEWPFPGFSRHLIGLSAGEKQSKTHKFAADSEYSNLRGKKARFDYSIESVKLRTLPEINAAFAQSIGKYETVEELRSEIRKSLENERKEEYDSNYSDRVMDELFKLATWKYPPQMLEHECESFQKQLENRLTQQKMDLPTYLKIRQLDEAGLKEEIKPMAEQRLKRTLILLEIAKQHDIKVTEEQLQAESMRTLDQISQSLPANKIRKTMTNEFVRGMIGNIGADLLVQKTWEYLHQLARGEQNTPDPKETILEEPTI